MNKPSSFKSCLFVFGTRPEAIKLAPVIKKFKSDNDIITKVCVTAQHRDMLDQVLNFFDLHVDFDLNLMSINQTLSSLSSKILLELDKVVKDLKPDLILVHGDTTSAMIAALTAFYNGIKIAHIEAGLRTYNKLSPYPEEMNRQLVSKLADFHFAPTLNSEKNLLEDNIRKENILITGNTVIDALIYTKEKVKNINQPFDIFPHNFENKIIITVTVHRRENFGIGLDQICQALIEISKLYTNLYIVLPVHPNPNVRDKIRSNLENFSNILLINPLRYDMFVWLLYKSKIILTDSGGIQEEAPSLGIPILLLRETTERPEAIEAGVVKMVGTSKNKIIYEVTQLLNNNDYYNKMSGAINPYGDGKASEKIYNFLKTIYEK